MRVQSVLLGASLLSTVPAFAFGSPTPTPNGDVFDSFKVPDALCGDGSAYSVYVRQGNPAKVLLHFEGGGACWSGSSCFGKIKFTSLRNSPGIKDNKYLGKHIGDTSFDDYTYVYLPYCTGDMHGGSHKANYGKDKTVLHFGRGNVSKALDWLQENQNQLISRADDVVLYGESAGAIGVIFNLDQVASLAGAHANKVALVDSPGLHFSDSIWNRFTPNYLRDIDRSLASNSMTRNKKSGILAPELKSLCQANPDWKVGVSQSTKDIVMSTMFGSLTPAQHRVRVLGKSGIDQNLWDPNDNCAAWVPDNRQHVFSIEVEGWAEKTSDGVRNADFTLDLLSRRLLDRHPSHH